MLLFFKCIVNSNCVTYEWNNHLRITVLIAMFKENIIVNLLYSHYEAKE